MIEQIPYRADVEPFFVLYALADGLCGVLSEYLLRGERRINEKMRTNGVPPQDRSYSLTAFRRLETMVAGPFSFFFAVRRRRVLEEMALEEILYARGYGSSFYDDDWKHRQATTVGFEEN